MHTRCLLSVALVQRSLCENMGDEFRKLVSRTLQNDMAFCTLGTELKKGQLKMKVELFLLLSVLLLSIESLPRRFGSQSRSRRSWGGIGLGSRRSSSGWASQQSSSSYPRQTWGSSSSYPRQTLGSRSLGGGGFVNPKQRWGTYSAPGGKTFGSSTPGHGTSWGTSFPSGVGQ